MYSKQIVLSASTISVDGTSVGSTYDISLQDPLSTINDLISFFTISGSATLSSSLTITSTAAMQYPAKLCFLSRANINLAGNTITIFGIQLNQFQAENPFRVDAWWDGVQWQASLSQQEVKNTGIINNQLADMSAGTVKMNSGNTQLPPQDVLVSDLAAILNTQYDFTPVVVDFNSGFLNPVIGRQDVLVPYKGEVTRVFGYVTQQINSSDDGFIQFGVAGSAGGGYGAYSTLTFTAGSSPNTFEIDLTPNPALNQFNANNYLVLEAQKNTWGGRVTVTIVTKRSI